MNTNNINISFAINKAYVPYWSVCLASILANMDEKDHLEVSVFSAEDIGEENKRKIDLLQARKPFSLKFCDIPSSLFKDIAKSSQKHITNDTNFRFLMASLNPNLDKCIFLDADLVVVQNIRNLWDCDITGVYIAAVEDEAATKPNSWAKKLPLPANYKYLNTGVSLCNLKKWREDNIEKKLFLNAQKHKNFLMFPDQDVLNITLCEKVKYLPPYFNAMPVQGYRNEEARKEAFSNPIIIHYAGIRKPWDVPSRPYADYFWKYAKLSPFYEELLMKMINFHINQAQRVTIHKTIAKNTELKKYYLYKVLSKITWGKTRRHYQQKRDSLHQQVRQIREFLKK